MSFSCQFGLVFFLCCFVCISLPAQDAKIEIGDIVQFTERGVERKGIVAMKKLSGKFGVRFTQDGDRYEYTHIAFKHAHELEKIGKADEIPFATKKPDSRSKANNPPRKDESKPKPKTFPVREPRT